MGIDFEPIKPLIGAIVHGGRETLRDDDVVRQCLDQLEDRTVLVFPRIGLSDEEQLELTDRLGSRVSYSENVPGGTTAGADIYEITLDTSINNEPEYVLSTFFWHFDGAHGHIAPPKASLLAARGVADKGGQTEFCNTFAAYEHLPDEEKAEIEGLRVRHSIISSMRPFADFPSEEDCARWIDAVFKSREAEGDTGGTSEHVPGSLDYEKEHPLVWTHASGRKSLVLGVSADRVVGMPLPEGPRADFTAARMDGPARLHLSPPMAGRRPRHLRQSRRAAPGDPLRRTERTDDAPHDGLGRGADPLTRL